VNGASARRAILNGQCDREQLKRTEALIRPAGGGTVDLPGFRAQTEFRRQLPREPSTERGFERDGTVDREARGLGMIGVAGQDEASGFGRRAASPADAGTDASSRIDGCCQARGTRAGRNTDLHRMDARCIDGARVHARRNGRSGVGDADRVTRVA
jgi:hypothetical protein